MISTYRGLALCRILHVSENHAGYADLPLGSSLDLNDVKTKFESSISIVARLVVVHAMSLMMHAGHDYFVKDQSRSQICRFPASTGDMHMSHAPTSMPTLTPTPILGERKFSTRKQAGRHARMHTRANTSTHMPLSRSLRVPSVHRCGRAAVRQCIRARGALENSTNPRVSVLPSGPRFIAHI